MLALFEARFAVHNWDHAVEFPILRVTPFV